ncbi:MAG: hypothetical protein JST84_05210 [Acidobacteria bacterium]|nr:hypothetical protein [Acidobacteriota bacterium]
MAYDYRAGHYQLVLCYNHPTPAEIQAAAADPAEFALKVVGPVIFVCFRFGRSIPWSDAPFSIHLAPEAVAEIPAPATRETRILLQVFLVDASTGILKAMRAFTFSPAFSRALEAGIAKQQEQPFDRPIYDQSINQVQRQFTSHQLAASAAITCRGGE